MSENDDTPHQRPRRLITRPEGRDELSERARRDRTAAPHEVQQEVTGQFEGEELREARGRRPTNERLERLEEKGDRTAALIERFDSKLDTIIALGERSEAERKRRSDMDAAERAAKRSMVVPVIRAIGIAVAIIIAALLGRGGVP